RCSPRSASARAPSSPGPRGGPARAAAPTSSAGARAARRPSPGRSAHAAPGPPAGASLRRARHAPSPPFPAPPAAPPAVSPPFGPWTGYGVTGRNQAKPFGYFPRVMGATVGAWRWLALPAAALAIGARERLGLALCGWAAAALAVYSALPYKTPWCALEIDL